MKKLIMLMFVAMFAFSFMGCEADELPNDEQEQLDGTLQTGHGEVGDPDDDDEEEETGG